MGSLLMGQLQGRSGTLFNAVAGIPHLAMTKSMGPVVEGFLGYTAQE
jgi:hypothetical protein